ncbi:MAG: hypothetical protein PHQ98_00105 [Candidatus ainarchaeum sp.]|nr:hypothetical protein [Candidatus ainarchaeum sp.]
MPGKSIVELNSVKDYFTTLGGSNAIELLKICENKKKPFTDEEVSKKMEKKVTEVRSILNKLHYQGIATYQKSRNQKTGWFNYTWEIKKDRIAQIIIDKQKENLTKLNSKSEIENEYNFFTCKDCDERIAFELAIEYNFICPACGGKMDSKATPSIKDEIDKQIKQIKQEIEVLEKINR